MVKAKVAMTKEAPKKTMNKVGKKGVPDAGFFKEAGEKLHAHAVKHYKEHAPKVIAHAKSIANKVGSSVLDEGSEYVKNNAKAKTPKAAHGVIDKAVGEGKKYLKGQLDKYTK